MLPFCAYYRNQCKVLPSYAIPFCRFFSFSAKEFLNIFFNVPRDSERERCPHLQINKFALTGGLPAREGRHDTGERLGSLTAQGAGPVSNGSSARLRQRLIFERADIIFVDTGPLSPTSIP